MPIADSRSAAKNLLDHLVGAGEQCGRHVEAEHLRGRQIDHRLPFSSIDIPRLLKLLQRMTYCESSVVQKMQRCAGVKVNSRAKNLGSSDWNSSSALAYAAHEGVLGPFGSPVLAN